MSQSQKEELVYFINGPEEPSQCVIEGFQNMIDYLEKELSKAKNSEKQQATFIKNQNSTINKLTEDKTKLENTNKELEQKVKD